MLFTDKTLKDLEKLKFVIETIPEPTLEDIPRTPSRSEGKVLMKNGVELPPSNKNGIKKELEKEEGN